jgi:hypothetical protein
MQATFPVLRAQSNEKIANTTSHMSLTDKRKPSYVCLLTPSDTTRITEKKTHHAFGGKGEKW